MNDPSIGIGRLDCGSDAVAIEFGGYGETAITSTQGHFLECRPPETTPRNQQRHRLQYIGLAGTIGPMEDYERMSRLQSHRTVVAELGNVEPVERFPSPQGGRQPAQAQDVIEMAVRNQDAIQSFEAQTAAQELALRAFATVNHEPVFAMHHHRGR